MEEDLEKFMDFFTKECHSTFEKVLKACKTARNMLASTQSDLEVALEKAKSKRNTAGRASAETAPKKLGKALGDLKAMLSRKNNKDPASIKKKLTDVAKIVKEAKDETKELKSVGGKAQYTAGSRRGH